MPPGSAADLGEDTQDKVLTLRAETSLSQHVSVFNNQEGLHFNLNKAGDFIEVLLHTHD